MQNNITRHSHLTRRLLPGLLALLFTLVIALPALAQTGRPTLDDVWVTTQDFSNLRVGPGQNWAVLAVIDPATTLRATGRTVEGGWIQVAYEGALLEDAPDDATIDGLTYGWIADWLLVWTGDILTLPVDGVRTVSIARRSNPRITIGPGTRYYRDGVDPSTRVTAGVISEATEVELTGRIGGPGSGYYWLQFRMNGEYFWTATWEVGEIRNSWLLPDGSYIYSYGRLLGELISELSRNRSILGTVAGRWRDLDAGREVTCNNIPLDAGITEGRFTELDLRREPIYEPTVRALQTAIPQINTALSLLRDVCSRSGADRYVRSEDVQRALAAVAEAERYITLASTLLPPLGRRDPLLGNVPGN